MGFMDLNRARDRMRAADLDGLLILSPHHFYYASGHSSWFMNLYGAAGYGAAILSEDPNQAPAALVSDVEEGPFRESAPEFTNLATYPVWIAYGDVPPPAPDAPLSYLTDHSVGQPTVRSGQIDPSPVLDQICRMVGQMGLAAARIGVESAFISASVQSHLQAALPQAHFVDSTRLLTELRAVKSPREAALLRRGTQLAEAGISQVLAMAQPGVTGSEIARCYREAVFAHADGGDVLSARITLRVGPQVLSPQAAGAYALQKGDLIFLDCGVEVAGYWADMGRCAVLGRATPLQRQIYAALGAGFAAAIPALRAGNPPAILFRAGMQAVHVAGLTSYVRGNLGHGIGLARAPELPILSAEETLVLAAGQVISVEFPYYLQGVGGFQLEDTFYLTEEGAECFNRLDRTLVEVG